MIWLGQSVDTSSLCASYAELRGSHFLTSLGCAIRRPSLTKTHFHGGLRHKLGITGPLMLDSGGFALLANPRAKWTTSSVAKLIAKIGAEIYVSLDLPPATGDTAERRRKKIHNSYRNYEFLSEQFPDKIIMPVIHGRTDLEIDLSIHLLNGSKRPPSWIGLGGIVPLLQHRYVSKDIFNTGPELFIAKALTKIRQAFPKARIHAFGAGGTRTFPAVVYFGADSADSIGWRQAAGFGSIFLPLRSQRVVTWNVVKSAPRKLLDNDDLDLLRDCCCPSCLASSSIETRLTALRGNFVNRSIHNAWTIKTQYKHWPKAISSMTEFIGNGNLGPHWAKALCRMVSR